MEIRNKNADPDAKQLPAVVHPNVVLSPHPLSASAGRKLFYTEFIAGESLDVYLTRNNLMPPTTNNFVISVNGTNVAFDKLDTVFPRRGDMVIIRARVHGGGEGSNPVVIVLMIAVLVASRNPQLALAVGSAVGGGAAVGSAIIVIGGMLLISALLPANVPSFDESTPDPTYSLSGSANRSRPYEPLPVVFGVVRMYPDHAARPFTAYELTARGLPFAGSDQKLLQIFNFGLTNPELSDPKIGDAPLSDFIGVDYEQSIGTTGEITSFPTNVDSLAGGDLVPLAGTFIERTSSADTTRLVIDISGLSFFIGRKEGLTEARLTLTAEYRVSGSADPWLPFFRSGGETTGVFPYIVNYTYSNTVDIVNGDKEIMRLAYHHIVPLGQYEVRLKLHDLADIVYHRTSCDEEGENCVEVTTYSARGLNAGGMSQVLSWDQLKSYQPDLGDYSGQKRFALELRANAQLQGRVDSFNAIASVTIPSWNGAAWVSAVSSNPADQFLALARGAFDASGRRLYGAGLADSRIDISAIEVWADWCTDKSLECNIVMTAKMTVIDMMNTVARVGRGATTWSNGLLGVVFDEEGKSPVAMFGMSNIIRNSFKVNYISENQVDEVVVAFNNPDIGWKRDEVRVTVPEVVNPVNTVTIEIPGITDEAQAAKEANLIAAEQFYRRRIISWETDIEGLTVQRGDVSVLAHDMTQWDHSGRLIAGPTTSHLTLDRAVPFNQGDINYIGVRYPDGTYVIRDVDFMGVANILPSPEAFDSSSWAKKDMLAIPNNINAPDGTLNADKIAPTSSALYADVHLASAISIAIGLSTFSVYLKAGEYTKGRLLMWNATDTARGSTNFDLILGTVQSGTGSIENIGDGWYRCSVEGTNTIGIEQPHFYALDDSWSATFVGNSFDGIYAWGAMLTEGGLEDYINEHSSIVLTTPLPTAPDADVLNDTMDYLWFFAPKATPGKLVKITDVTPLSEDRVRIIATDEEDDYYLSESDTYTYVTPTPYTTDIPTISDLGLGESLIIVGSGFASKVNVSWNVSGEYGGAFIRAGDESTPLKDIGRTLDQRFSFEWTTGKTVEVEVTLHNKNYEMSDVSRDTASLLLVGKRKLPDDVTNFSVLQNGDVAIMKWTQVADVDLAGYEIRFGLLGASTYEDATPLTSVTRGTNVTSADVPPGSWTVFIKAVDTSGNYSENATSRDIVFVSNRDVIVQTPQAPFTVAGTVITNFVVHHTGKLVPQSQEADSDDGAVLWANDTVFEIFVNNPFQICEYTAPEIDIDFDDDVRLWGTIESELGQGITVGVANPLLEIDYRLDAGAYDGFEVWSIGNVYARYFKHKLVLDTDVGLAVITEFTPTVDQLEHTIQGLGVVLAASWTTITFIPAFHNIPYVLATVISSTSKFAVIDNLTTTSFDVAIFNAGGALSPGTINWEARGI